MEQYNQAVELWQSYKIASVADLDKYLDSFRILFAFHSGKIENEEVKHLYYECLQKYDEAEELDSLYEFFKRQTEKTWEKALALTGGAKQDHKGLSDFV